MFVVFKSFNVNLKIETNYYNIIIIFRIISLFDIYNLLKIKIILVKEAVCCFIFMQTFLKKTYRSFEPLYPMKIILII